MLTLDEFYRRVGPSVRKLVRAERARARERMKTWEGIKPGQKIRILMGGKPWKQPKP